MDEDKPLFQQIAGSIEDQIVSGALPEGSAAPSTNALAAFHRINPATAAKGMRLLQDEGILEKRRGLGLFVTRGARSKLLKKRQGSFEAEFVLPMLVEAAAIGLQPSEVAGMVQDGIVKTFPGTEPSAENLIMGQAGPAGNAAPVTRSLPGRNAELSANEGSEQPGIMSTNRGSQPTDYPSAAIASPGSAR